MRIMAGAKAVVAISGLLTLAACTTTPSDGRFAGVEGVGAHGNAAQNAPAATPRTRVKPATPETPSTRADDPASAAEAPAPQSAPVPKPAPAPAAPGEPVAPPFAGLTTSQTVVDILKEAEGLRLEAYEDGAGNWFIGYGHQRTAAPGMTITEEDAEALLRDDLAVFEEAVRKHVNVPITAGEFSALTYFAYTIGTGAFASSSVVRLLNAGDRAGAADAFLLWTKVRRNGELVESPGLVKVRQKQRALFLGETG